MKKTIVVQARPLSIGISGNQNFTVNFLPRLISKMPDYNFELLVPQPFNSNVFDGLANCKIIILQAPKTDPEYLTTVLWEQIIIKNYITDKNYEDIALLLSTHHSLPVNLPNIKKVAIIHDIDLWINHNRTLPIERQLADDINLAGVKQADIIFTVSQFTKDEIERNWSYLNPVIPIFEDIDQFYKTDQKLDADELTRFKVEPYNYFLYIGSYEPRKNVNFLINSYQDYLSVNKNPKKLLIIGDHTARSKSLVEVVLPDNIIQHNFVNIKDSYLLYKYAAAFIYPSSYEGFGLQILEAQNTDCPLILSDIAVFHEIAGVAGLFFSLNDKSSLIDAMNKIDDKNIRQQLIVQGKKNITRFSWDNTVDKFIKYVQR